MKVEIFGNTNPGMKRDHNEDYFLTDPIGLAILCDGVGGRNAGEVASKLAAEGILSQFRKDFKKAGKDVEDDHLKKLIKNCFQQANSKVLDYANKNPDKKGMATTGVFSFIRGKKAYICHIGDSRLYLLRRGEAHQITTDHSIFNQLVHKEGLPREEARKHPHAKALYQAIGSNQYIVPDCIVVELEPKDQMVLCSDGLSDYLSGPKQLLSLAKGPEGSELIEKLIQFANDSGGKDNITVIGIKVIDPFEKKKVNGKESESYQQEDDASTQAENKIKILKRIPIFSHLDYVQINRILEAGDVGSVSEKVQIIREGHTGDEMFVILSGKYAVIKDGVEKAKLSAGDWFGEMAMIDEEIRSASVVCDSPGHLLRLKKNQMFKLIEKNSDLGMKLFWGMLQNLNKRLRKSEKELHEFHLKDQS